VLGVDTETTSLEPHKEGGRVIAISLSVGDSYSVAFPLDHREASYTTEQREAILNRFENLMNSENTVTCAANGKFDYKWLHHVYGLNINFFDFDVLLAEHILSEDKVGEYNLKSLTRDYCPGFAGYEEKLDIELRNIKRQKKEAYQAEKDKQLKKFCSDWESFSNEKRKTYLETWVAEKYIPATRIKEFTEIRRVKKLGQMIISKNYFNGLMKTLGQVPLEALGIELADQPETTFEDVSLETLLWYAAVDAYTTRSIFAAQYKMMSEEFLLIKRRGFEKLTIPLFQGFTDITMPLAAKIQDMEFIGVRLDREKAETYMDIIDDKLATIKEALFSDIGRKINLSSSSSDLRNFIFKDRKCTPIKYTDSGQAALDTGVLKELYDIHNDHFFKNLVTYRKLSKAKSAYIANFLKMSDYDGRLHFSLHQNQTATYRLSASKPSMQNVPFRLEEADLNLKSLFIPDSDDYEFYDLDIANAEMRVLCAYSRDETLIDAFDNNMDLHSLTGSKVSSFSYEQLESKKEDKHSEEYRCRQLGKKINFGTVYCVGAETLKNQLWSDLRVEVSLKEAEEYLNKFFKEYPGVKNYIDYTKKLASKHRFVTTFTGRRRRFPLIRRRGFYRGGMERQSVNSRIQSTSADIMNTNLVDLADVIEPLGGRIVLTVHDSILFQLPKGAKGVPEMLDEVFIKRTGERFPWLPVKWKYDVWKGPSYGDCKQPVF
jgi:DNA polymerase I-like protein with 3'-5' exonuclease and polymerase domains